MSVAGLFVGNFFYSVTKKSFSTSVPDMIEGELRLTKSDIGSITSAFALTYGVSKLLGGVLSDIFPAYMLYILGLLLGSFVNIAVTQLGSWQYLGIWNHNTNDPEDISKAQKLLLKLLWALNGLSQGIGGPALAKLVMLHYPESLVSSIWSTLNFVRSIYHIMQSPHLLRCRTNARS